MNTTLDTHAGGSNPTSTRRPADATFEGNQDSLTDEELACLRAGGPLDDDARRPIVLAAVPA